MEEGKPRIKVRNIERTFLVLIFIVLGLLFFKLHLVLQRDFKEVHQRLEDGTMVNLNDKNPGKRIKTLLERGYYFEDKKDISLIESVVTKALHAEEGQIDNVGELNKRKYNVVADEAFVEGGESFKKRVTASRSLLGYTGDDSLLFIQERTKLMPLPTSTDIGMGGHTAYHKAIVYPRF